MTKASLVSQDKRRVYGRRDATVPGLHCRAAVVQLQTVDADRHSVQATLVTETPVPMWDYREGRMFDEVLLASGGRWRNHVPMLDSHYRYSSRATLGSVHDRRQVGAEWQGRLDFVRGDPEVDQVWLRVEQGHLRGVSAGYSYMAGGEDVVRIPAGQTQLVSGRSFTAGEREMRVVRKWTGHEVSTTPIQADENSHTRSSDPSDSSQSETGGERVKNRPVAYQVDTTGDNIWPREGSRDAIGDSNGDGQVPPQLLQFLRSLGLNAQASDHDAWAFYNSLQGGARSYADSLLQQRTQMQPNQPPQVAGQTGSVGSGAANMPSSAGVSSPGSAGSPSQQRSAEPPAQYQPGYHPQPPMGGDYVMVGYDRQVPIQQHPVNMQDEGQRSERERVLTIQALGRGVDPNLVNQAIAEGWDLNRARTEFAPIFFNRTEPAQNQNGNQVRSETADTLSSQMLSQNDRGQAIQTGTPNNPGQAPAGHSQDSLSPSLRTLQAALIMRERPQLLQNNDSSRYLQQAEVRQALTRSQGDWLGTWSRTMEMGGQVPNDMQDAARAVDSAWQYRDWHVMDFVRECCRLSGTPIPANKREMFERAISTAEATALFTTNFQVMMLSGFMGVEDTTRDWVFVDDVANWQAKEYVQKGLVGRLRQKSRTAAPDQATFEVTNEELQVKTYAARWDMEREDAFDDRLGGLDGTIDGLGEAAAEVRPDLVYALLTSNPNLQNGNAAFQTAGTDVDNLTTGLSIDETSFNTVITKMTTQTNHGRPITCRPQYGIFASSKSFAVNRLLKSVETRNTTATTREGTYNPAQGLVAPRFEQRLDTGWVNPLTEATIAATPNVWYFSENASGQKGMGVVYLRADGRNPITDTYRLTEGRIGMGWSLNMVIGAGFIGRNGIAKATG